MEIKYQYNNKIVIIDIGEKLYSNNRIIGFFKNSLRKKLGISIYEYLLYKEFKIEKCRLCGVGYPPININFTIIKNFINIISFDYSKKIYCYGDNSDCVGIKLNSNSFEFISKVNRISIEDAKKYIKENNKSPFYKENHKSQDDYKKSQSRSLDYYIDRYGEEIGNRKYKEHINKISVANSEERYIEKYGKEGYKKFKEVSNSKNSMSLNFFINKNNGNYEKALFEYDERKKSVSISLSSMIERYGGDGILKHKNMIEKSKNTLLKNPNYKEICKSKAINIEKMINKYGESLGREKYNNWVKSCSVPICRSSKESLKIFNPLIEELIHKYSIEYDDIYLGVGTKNEYFIRGKEGIFFYDFTIKSKKIIIEYNGIIFHPKNKNSNWINPFTKIGASESYEKQKKKINIAEKNGFMVLEIWSDDSNNLEKCLEFIKNNMI